MKGNGFENKFFTACVALSGIFAAVLGYCSPSSVENAAPSAISALSIIFGLSAAVSSMFVPGAIDRKSLSNDPDVAARLMKIIKSDDERLLRRQRELHILTLTAVIIGILFLAVYDGYPCALPTKLLSAAFGMTALSSLLFAMMLPGLLAKLIKRNTYLKSNFPT